MGWCGANSGWYNRQSTSHVETGIPAPESESKHGREVTRMCA
jgi:hypothetical protein